MKDNCTEVDTTTQSSYLTEYKIMSLDGGECVTKLNNRHEKLVRALKNQIREHNGNKFISVSKLSF